MASPSSIIAARLSQVRDVIGPKPMSDDQLFGMETLPPTQESWPEVSTRPDPEQLLIASVPTPVATIPYVPNVAPSTEPMGLEEARTATNFGAPGGQRPGVWLLHRNLRG